jgi:hypothetical protein
MVVARRVGRGRAAARRIRRPTVRSIARGDPLMSGLFGRRRRRDEADDAVMAAAAATGIGAVPDTLAAPATHSQASVAVEPIDGIAAAAGDDVEPGEMEALMPRWRRPSLIQARKANPNRAVAPAHHLTFDEDPVGPLNGCERRVVRYRVVRLLDVPDELRGAEIGCVDRGDEVQLLEKHGVYWLVLSPDGQQGWLHQMTLGGLVGAEDEDAPVECPVARMPVPVAVKTPAMSDTEVDPDVFNAYLESRRRRA